MIKSPSRPALRKKILIVNCYLDPSRTAVKRKLKIPQTMTPAYLAGIFAADRCWIKLYDEVYSGPLEDETLLSFPDMLVLTGLNVAFDRMRHITAYAKTKNPKTIVVAGGPAIRALFQYAHKFFDHCCRGDIEQLSEVVEDELGPEYVSREYREHGWVMPRFDLAYWMKLLAYVESSRNCYFRCNYCSLTAEKGFYQPYPIEYLRRQIMQLGTRRLVHFSDNNFASNNKNFVAQRFALLRRLYDQGHILRWAGEVTCDFFLDGDNLKQAAASGCGGLFCGVESFDPGSLTHFNKHQNNCMPQVEMIQTCLQANIPFHYGVVFDFSTRAIAELAAELDFIVNTPEIPLPSFITLAIPLLKTPMFHKCIAERLFLPNLRLRDLDGSTLCLKTIDPLPAAVKFLLKIKTLSGYRKRIIKHIFDFYGIYRKVMAIENIAMSQYGALLLSAPQLFTLESDLSKVLFNHRHNGHRTHVGATECLDPVYRPAFRIDRRYRHFFEPTHLTDANGDICEALQPDLLDA